MKKKGKRKNKTTKKIFEIIFAILLPLGGGFLISLLTMNAIGQFNTFKQPPLTPPAWLFPVAWSILYILMGIASYFIYKLKKSKSRKVALTLYLIQLGFNFLWTIIFFNFHWFWLAFIWLAIMWVIILVLMVKTIKISKPAFYLLLPYLLWCTFAAYLNIGIAMLN